MPLTSVLNNIRESILYSDKNGKYVMSFLIVSQQHDNKAINNIRHINTQVVR